MRSLRLVLLFALCVFPTMLPAQSGIQILSQSYNINAAWSVSWWQNGSPYPLGDWSAGYSSYPMTGGYNLSSTDGTPLAASTAAVTPPAAPMINVGGQNSPYESASASIGLFSVQDQAYAYATGGPPSFAPDPTAIYMGSQDSYVNTSVQAVWQFSPMNNSLDASISGLVTADYGPVIGMVTLSDLTDSTSLLNTQYSSFNSSSEDYQFSVNPSDVYELSISGSAQASDNDSIGLNISASITSAPEPGSCGLLSLGLAVFWGLKSWLKKSSPV